MRKPVAVADLQFGMYVAELDRPWTDTPFVFQGFVLQSPEQLEILKRYCKTVFVDCDRSEVISGLSDTIPPRIKMQMDLSRSGKFRWSELLPVDKEYANAEVSYTFANRAVRECIVALRSGKVLQPDTLHAAVNGVAESVLRNPDAMLLFTQLEEKGEYTQSHALDCAIYMTAFARFLSMSRQDIVLLGHVGLLQDIGKLRLPDALIAKPGRLTASELQLVKKHVEYSDEILRATPRLPPGVVEYARLHHERHDGSGYPGQLKGRDIGLIGSMAGIIDTFDALTAKRPYAQPLSPSNALNVLYKCRGTLFDAYLVEQFIRCIGIFPLGSIVELNGGEVGIVIAQNRARRLQPRVMIMRDAVGDPVRPHKVIDLANGITAPDGEPYRIKRTLESGTLSVGAKELFLHL